MSHDISPALLTFSSIGAILALFCYRGLHVAYCHLSTTRRSSMVYAVPAQSLHLDILEHRTANRATAAIVFGLAGSLPVLVSYGVLGTYHRLIALSIPELSFVSSVLCSSLLVVLGSFVRLFQIDHQLKRHDRLPTLQSARSQHLQGRVTAPQPSSNFPSVPSPDSTGGVPLLA